MTRPFFYESRTCLECGKNYSGYGATFCGRTCCLAHKNRVDNPAKNEATRAKISEIAKARGTQHMMTPEARAKAETGISVALKGRKLSQEHRARIREGAIKAGCRPPRDTSLVGEKHPNWRGGHSGIRDVDFKRPEYKQFRAKVVARDDWTCQDCGRRGGRVEVHHVKPWGPHPELRYEITNGITLCVPCHKTRHRGIPKPVTAGPRTLAELLSSQSEA